MKHKIRKRFIVIPTGLFLISSAVLISQRFVIPDYAKGILFGIPIGIMLILFMSIRLERTNNQITNQY